jgi:DNA-binding NarL/FixJ family response regulator
MMRVLITDDHQLFIDGMRHILQELDVNVVVSESSSAEQAIEILESGQRFDLVLIDLSMPGMDGLSILQRMDERKLCLPLVVISGEEDSHKIKQALDAGALGFIPKSHSSQQMLEALRAILQGEIYLPQTIQKKIDRIDSRRVLSKSQGDSASKAYGITQRQLDVLTLIAKGYSNKQIALSLCLTEHTVKSHLNALFKLLDAKNRTECVRNASQRGIVTTA